MASTTFQLTSYSKMAFKKVALIHTHGQSVEFIVNDSLAAGTGPNGTTVPGPNNPVRVGFNDGIDDYWTITLEVQGDPSKRYSCVNKKANLTGQDPNKPVTVVIQDDAPGLTMYVKSSSNPTGQGTAVLLSN